MGRLYSRLYDALNRKSDPDLGVYKSDILANIHSYVDDHISKTGSDLYDSGILGAKSAKEDEEAGLADVAAQEKISLEEAAREKRDEDSNSVLSNIADEIDTPNSFSNVAGDMFKMAVPEYTIGSALVDTAETGVSNDVSWL